MCGHRCYLPKEKTLNDYIPSMKTGSGIFSAISSIKWWPELNASQFDTYFALKYGNHAGFKDFLEPFTNDNGVIEGEQLNTLSFMILNVNQNHWDHVYKALMSEYNPAENTDYVEEHKDNSTANGSNTTTTTGSIENAGDVYGFNSSTEVPSDKSTTSYNDHQIENTSEGSSEKTLKISKHGNIGTVDVATMLRNDVDFWSSAGSKIADIMYMDICNIIALSIY